ncbi:hypothetical protein SKAU_G00326380 [Synaphobranchus kaupii]|uniref:Reverse transcriptase domain-containing protein n=1 Tax=Synaphobranchus kaupii TaxID=118154 RepID=A0A9Q1EPM9_SYNKA|nr:hypothetical protein SKAU_G00326380 [Synaphobranchus kaupii]
MDIIQCSALTNESDEDDKEEFYSRLLTIIQARQRQNIIITMGDFTAKIGSNNRGYEEIMGQKDLGADVASDHHLLVARIKLKLRRNWAGENSQHQRYNTTALKEKPRLEEFKVPLSNKFQVLQELLEEETIDEKWQGIKEAVTSTCQGVLGTKKHSHKEWISAETLKKIEERKNKEEIRKAIKQLRNGKSAGPDNIPAEALKADVETSVAMLYPLFRNIWDEEMVPSKWKEGYLIKLLKKGDLSSCSNYKGITLLSIPGKTFNRVLLNRMKDAVDPQLQAGFRKNRSCTDQITTLRIILEQSLEWNSPLSPQLY